MTSSLRFLALVFAALLLARPVHASTYSVDYTDQWWNSAESGWGLNLIQQGDTMFGTLFVYDQNGTSHWYTATLTPASTGSLTNYSGSLIETFGPWFGNATFNPNGVNRVGVGTMSVAFSDENHGTLDYVVNAVHVTKSITRQTWRAEVLTGNYLGGLTAQGTNCTNGVNNGPILTFGQLAVQQSAATTTMTVSFTSSQGQSSQCVFSGTYSQAGHLGSISGNWNCTLGTTAYNQGTFTVGTIQSSTTGFSGVFTGRDQFCTYSGQFGGVKDVL